MSNQSAKKDPSMDEILASIREIISDDVQGTAPKIKRTRPDFSVVSNDDNSKDEDVLTLTEEVPTEAEQSSADVIEMASTENIHIQKSPREVTMALVEEAKKEEEEAVEAEAETVVETEATEDAPEPANESEPEAEATDAKAEADATPEAETEAEAAAEEATSDDMTAVDEILEAVEEVPADTIELTEEAPVDNPLAGEDLVSADVAAAASDALSGLDSLESEISTAVTNQIDGSKSVEQLMSDILRPMLKNWLDANLPSIVKVIVTEQVEKVIRSRGQ